jgi:hypothetical protein
MEKITAIKSDGFRLDPNEDRWSNDFDGYTIETTQQTIKIGISSGQSCCESFGCIITNDDIADFIGAELKSLSIVDEAVNNKKIDELEYMDAGGAMFVNLETSVGLLQFVAYNAHNGYYGHDAVLVSKQVNASERL